MPSIPNKVCGRLVAGVKRFQPILASAKSRDINESDTVVIVADMLQEVFGYDKFTEVTSEHNIKGTYVDLAIKLDGSLTLLLELKAIGLELKDAYVKQAVDYAANQGVDWVVLTNGVVWRVYRIHFTKPIDCELVYEFNFLELNPKNDEHLELLWMLTKESWLKETLKEYHTQKQALSRFLVAALVRSEPILDVIRRELRRVSPGVRIESAQIEQVLVHEVLKRECFEGDKAEAAKKIVYRAAQRALRTKSANGDSKEVVALDAPVGVVSSGSEPDMQPVPSDIAAAASPE